MTYIWEYSPHKGSELITLLAIADHADDAGSAYPGIERLARKTRMTTRNVQYVLKKLVQSGELILHEHQGPNRVHVYQISMDTTKTFQGENFSGVKTFQGENQRQKRVKTSVAHIRNEPSLEPSKKKEKTPPPPSSGETEAASETIATPEEFVALYNANIPKGIPMVKTLSPERRQRIVHSLKDFPDRLFWLTCFRAPSTSPFLRGERPRDGHKTFIFDLDFLLRKGKDGIENCVKVYEGKYSNERDPPDPPAPETRDALADMSPRTQETIRQAQRSYERMMNNPRWNPAARKDDHAES